MDHHWFVKLSRFSRSSSGCPCYGLRIACLLAVSIFLFHFILIHLLVSKVIWTISTDVFQQPFQKFFGLLMKVARLLKHGTAFQPFWAKKGHKKFAFRRPSPTSSSRSSPTRRTPPWPSRILALAWPRTNWSTTSAPSQSQELRHSWKRWPREVTLAWLVSSVSASTAPTWSPTRLGLFPLQNKCFHFAGYAFRIVLNQPGVFVSFPAAWAIWGSGHQQTQRWRTVHLGNSVALRRWHLFSFWSDHPSQSLIVPAQKLRRVVLVGLSPCRRPETWQSVQRRNSFKSGWCGCMQTDRDVYVLFNAQCTLRQ